MNTPRRKRTYWCLFWRRWSSSGTRKVEVVPVLN